MAARSAGATKEAGWPAGSGMALPHSKQQVGSHVRDPASRRPVSAQERTGGVDNAGGTEEGREQVAHLHRRLQCGPARHCRRPRRRPPELAVRLVGGKGGGVGGGGGGGQDQAS